METPAQYFQRRRDLIAARLLDRITQQGISQNQLARMTNTSPRMVWDWVHAIHAPSDPYLRNLERVLGVPAGYFTQNAHSEEDAA